MKIVEFTAEADILGKPRTVQVRRDRYAEGVDGQSSLVSNVTIWPLDADEAVKLIEALGGKVAAAKVEAPAEAPSPAPAAAKPADKPKAAAKKADKPAPEKQEAKAAEDPKPEPAAEAAKEAKPDKAADKPKNGHSAAPAGKAIELPDSVKNAASMRDLLTWLAEHGGITSGDAMVAACEDLKAIVPILSKVPDVAGRVKRAVEVLGLFAQADEAAAG